MSESKKPKVTAKKFTAKKVGKTITAKFDGKTYTRQATPEEYANLAELHAKYKEKPTEKNAAALIKFLTPKTTAKKEAVVKKIVEKKAEAEAPKEKIRLVNEVEQRLKDGNVTQEEINEMEKLIVKAKAIVEPKPTEYKSHSGHEQYRRN